MLCELCLFSRIMYKNQGIFKAKLLLLHDIFYTKVVENHPFFEAKVYTLKNFCPIAPLDQFISWKPTERIRLGKRRKDNEDNFTLIDDTDFIRFIAQMVKESQQD